MSLRRQVLVGTLWTATATWAHHAIGFAAFVILARFLGPEAYGLVGIATVFIALGNIPIADGISQAVLQRQELEPEHETAAFWALIALAVTLALTLSACAELIAGVFHEPAVASLIPWLSLVLILEALTAVPTALLRRQLRFGPLALRSMLAVSCGGFVGIAMAVTDHGVWSLVGMTLTQNLVAMAVVWLASRWLPGRRTTRRHLEDLVGYGSRVIGIRFSVFLQNQIPRLLIGYSAGPTALGYYTIGWRILEMLSQAIVVPLSQVALPVFARAQSDRPRAREMFLLGTRMSTLLAFPAFLGLASVAPELIPGLFGAKWQPAVPVIQVFALLGLLFAVSYLQGALFRGLGELGWLNIASWARTALVTIFVLLVRNHEMPVIVAGIVLANLSIIPVSVYATCRILDLRVARLLGTYLPNLVAAAAMVAIVTVWRSLMTSQSTEPLLLAALSVTIGIAAYGILLLLVGRSSIEQAGELLRLLLQGRRREGVDVGETVQRMGTR